MYIIYWFSRHRLFEPGAAATCHFIQLFFLPVLLILFKESFCFLFSFWAVLIFLFLPQTKFAKLGVSTTRTVSAKAHKQGTIPINLTLPDPVLEKSTEILLLFSIFCNVDARRRTWHVHPTVVSCWSFMAPMEWGRTRGTLLNPVSMKT